MKGKILLAGGSGFLGSNLYTHLEAKGYEPIILTRKPNVKGYNTLQWNPAKGEVPVDDILSASAIVNLAGLNVGDKRWSQKFKEALVTSRTQPAELIATILNELEFNEFTFLNFSATGFYGFDRGEEELSEDMDPGNDFFGDLCFKWEKAAMKMVNPNVRRVILRCGVVFDAENGAYPKLKAPILSGFGAALASGNQWLPWIHLYDVLNSITWLLENKKATGAYNAVSPGIVTNKVLTRKIANSLNKQILLPNVPSFVLRLLVGEFAKGLTGSLKVTPKKLLDEGFTFQYPQLEDALRELNWQRKR